MEAPGNRLLFLDSRLKTAVNSRGILGEHEKKYRRIFVYTFCLINICLLLSDDANKIKTLNIKRA